MKPPDEYGEWFVNEFGQTVRIVVRWTPNLIAPEPDGCKYLPMVDVQVKNLELVKNEPSD